MDKGKDKSENILSLPVLMTQTMTTTSNTVEQEAEVEVKKRNLFIQYSLEMLSHLLNVFFSLKFSLAHYQLNNVVALFFHSFLSQSV